MSGTVCGDLGGAVQKRFLTAFCSFRGQKRHPTIEDRVVIYASVTILGGKTVIGHDSVVGANVWLTESIDPHTTVVLEKPRLRVRGKRDEVQPEANYQI